MAEKIEVVVRWPWETSSENQQLAIDLLRQILTTVQRIEAKENDMAETIESIGLKLDSVSASIQNVVGDISSLQQDIQALKDQLAAGTGVTQEQLEALGIKAGALAAAASQAADVVKP